VNELQQPMIILMTSAVGLVKVEDVRGVLLDFIKGKSLDVLEHVCGGSTPFPFVCIKSLVDELGNEDCVLYIVLFDMIHEAAYDAAIVGEDVGNLVGRVISILILPLELWVVSLLVTPNLNSKEAVAKDRFLASSLPVQGLLFVSVAISLAIS
jgi:hypothetical protein